ncbi:RNA polymerase, sigma subunit, ECF family [Aliiroseovarius halocynthiae]|nr:RNA polymerase, sigma subunit, ECF family [Aliiroseovarius halocynthiae]
MALDAYEGASDEALLVLYGNGDPVAAQLLTHRLAPRELGFATRLLGGDRAEAEDVVQEAMLRLWKQAESWRSGEAQVSTWLYRVVSNLCTDRLRKRRTVGLDVAGDPEDDRPSAVDSMMDVDRASALQDALNRLPDRQRVAVTLRHIEGATNPEIAKIMDISVEAVESLTARGKRALAKDLAGRRKELGYDET